MSVFKNDFTENIEVEIRKRSAEHHAAIEAMILNYLELTGLTIDEIELVEKKNEDFSVSWFCQKKETPGKFWRNAYISPAILKLKG